MISRIIAPVAAIGFVVTLISHVGLLFGVDILHGYWLPLFIGIFVVWSPTVLTMQKLGPAMQRKGGWRLALTGAPDWMRYFLYGTFLYGVINFILGVAGVFDIKGDNFWRVGSSHAMMFYAAAWALAVAANAREDQGIEWKCERGHDMMPTARFCEECGAPLRRGAILIDRERS